MSEAEKQEFEGSPDIAAHIARMAASGNVGSQHEWQAFTDAMNAALTAERQRADELAAENAALREALEPSADTKYAYLGEFKIDHYERDEDGEEIPCKILVPWTTIKEIMAAIKARAAMKEGK